MDLAAVSQRHCFGVALQFVRQSAVDRVARHDYPILLVGSPRLKEFSGGTALQHAWRCKHHTGTHVCLLTCKLVPVGHVLDVLEHPGVVASVGLFLDRVTAHICEGLEDPEALCGHRGVVIDRDLVQIRIAFPVILQYEEKFLRPTQCEHRQQALAALTHNLVHGVCKSMLSLLTRFVVHHAIRGLHNEHMNPHVGNFCLWQVPVFFPAVIASVEDADASDVDHEHRSPQDVPGTEAGELDSPILPLFVVVDEFYLVHALIDIHRAEDLILCRDLANPCVVVPQHPANRSRGVSHEDLALELGSVHEVRHRS
mmetsp:Transcript_71750/g.115857  ORF Transcript_71750/g.115857 Transcript_71750/m.115857 type:complete len:312 (+) Transcript_71750:853-1788(+)